MRWDDVMDNNAIKFIEGLSQYQSLINELVLKNRELENEHKKRKSQFEINLFNSFERLLETKGFSVKNIGNNLIAVNTKSKIELRHMGHKDEDGSIYIELHNAGKLFNFNICSSCTDMYIDWALDYEGKLICIKVDHEYTVDYYKEKYFELKKKVSEHNKSLNETTLSEFYIWLFKKNIYDTIGKYKTITEALDKIIELM